MAINQFIPIVYKLQSSEPLTAQEFNFLQSCQNWRPSWAASAWSYIKTPANQGSVDSINRLAVKVLQQEAPAIDEIEKSLRTYERLSDSEAQAFAHLVNQYLSRDDIFENRLRAFKSAKGRDPDVEELANLVFQFNQEIRPKISLAGREICTISYENEYLNTQGEITVRYDDEGYLEMNEGPVGPLKVRYNQTLTCAQEKEMIDLYQSLAGDMIYNNLGEMLEFMHFYEEEKKRQPELTLQQAYHTYHPDLASIYDKYKSGTCILLATKFRQELANRGIQAQVLSTKTLNPWSSLPVPGAECEMRWHELMQHTKGVDHSDVACLYTDESGKNSILRFKCSFDKTTEEEIKKYETRSNGSCWTRFVAEFPSNSYYPNRVIDHGEIGKARLLGRYKAVVMKDGMIFGADFLRGNIYLRTSNKDNLPLNNKGLVSIELSDLTTPDVRSTYTVNGVPTEMSHREALRMILNSARSTIDLPPDTEENLLALAKFTPELLGGFFLQPIPLIQQNYQDLAAITKKIKEFEESAPPTYCRLLSEYNTEIVIPISENDPNITEKIQQFKARVMETV